MATENVTKLIEEVKALTVLELSELVKALEEELAFPPLLLLPLLPAPLLVLPLLKSRPSSLSS